MLVADSDGHFERGERTRDLTLVKCQYRRNELEDGGAKAVVQRRAAPGTDQVCWGARNNQEMNGLLAFIMAHLHGSHENPLSSLMTLWLGKN